jgi:hypothetical protein
VRFIPTIFRNFVYKGDHNETHIAEIAKEYVIWKYLPVRSRLV